MMTDIEKLVALMSIECIGSTRTNQYIVKDKKGTVLNMEKFDYPNGDYAIYDLTNSEEMGRVKYLNNNSISVFLLESGLTYDVHLNSSVDPLSLATINTTPYYSHEIKVDDGKSSYQGIEYTAEKAPRPAGIEIK